MNIYYIFAFVVIVIIIVVYYRMSKTTSSKSNSFTPITTPTMASSQTTPSGYTAYDISHIPGGFLAMIYKDQSLRILPPPPAADNTFTIDPANPIIRITANKIKAQSTVANLGTTEIRGNIWSETSDFTIDTTTTNILSITLFQDDAAENTHDPSGFSPYTLANVPQGFFAVGLRDGTVIQTNAASNLATLALYSGPAVVMTNGVKIKVKTLENSQEKIVELSGIAEIWASTNAPIVSFTLA